MYDPILHKCYDCHKPFSEGDVAYPFYEHYLCLSCGVNNAPSAKPFIWFSSIDARRKYYERKISSSKKAAKK